ncbi:glycosyltransferase family 4 protein [Vibrio sp.]|nr:glycosyltransferase family 4 protein [Vibrio sp.]
MKICHVNLASSYHGGENQTLTLLKQQLTMGYELVVVAKLGSPFYRSAEELGCTMIEAKNALQSHGSAITKGCALIHVHQGRAIYWALVQHLLHGVPYIVTRRIDNPLKKKWLANIAYGKARTIVGLSTEIVNRIHAAYPNATVEKIPSSPVQYPTNKANLSAIHRQFEGKFLIIHAANMVPHKGFNVTIDAARQVEESHPNLHFALLGDGKERSNLELKAKGLSNITFMGKQSNMGDWFASANMQIHPSHSEGLGSVILEGLHAGLPVVATNAGGIPDIIDDRESGLLVPPGDPSALAERIIQLAECESLRQHVITGAKEKLKPFLIESTALRYEAIYQRIQEQNQ